MQENRKNKIALISGCTKRIGKHIALHLANSGWKIAIHYNNSEKEAKLLETQINSITQACIVQFDLNTQRDFKPQLEQINATLGKPTLLINNASIF